MDVALQVTVNLSYEDTINRVTEALKGEGFGVLTTIDVKATMKVKLDVDFRPYVILGACNPHLAHRALEAKPKVGVMLPCNVTVEEVDGGALVSIANPRAMMGMGDLGEDAKLKAVADEAYAKLSRVAEALNDQV